MTLPTSERHRRAVLSLVVLCLVQAMVILDGTVVTVALPRIQSDLGLGSVGLSWVMNGYLVAFAGFLLLAGRIGDLLGAARVFMVGVAGFTLASLLCGLAPDGSFLVAARVAQGLAAAAASAVALALLVRQFPSDVGRAWALGVFGFVGAAASSLGFVVGGALTETWGWRWAFFVNVPIGVVAAVAGWRLLVLDRGVGLSRGADGWGALLLTTGLSAGVYGIVSATDVGALRTTLWGAAAAILLTAFGWRERSSKAPLIDLGVLRRPGVWRPNVVFLLAAATGMGFQYVMALELQQVGGRDAWDTSLAFLPIPVVIAIVALTVSPRLVARWGARRVAPVGLAPVVVGMLLLSRMPLDAAYLTEILPGMLLAGAGMGLVIPALTSLAMADAGPEEVGLASGLVNTSQQVGAAVGIAVLASVAAGVGGATRSDLHDGNTAALAVAATIAGVAWIVGVVGLGRGGGGRSGPP